MKAFHFHLQRVLEWREMQVRLAEEKLNQLQQQLVTLKQQEEALRAGYAAAESQLLALPTMRGSEMQALAGFRLSTSKQLKANQTRQQECAVLVSEQRERMVKARRDHRVLEKLKEHRRRDWIYLNDREIEETAAEVFLANWSRPGNEPAKGSK